MHRLTAVAGEEKHLFFYRYPAAPGKPWHCYRSEKYNEETADKKLEDILLDLLTPSTTVEELEAIPHNAGSWSCPYLRLKQIELFAVPHNAGLEDDGEHLVLRVFTNSSRARSEGGNQYRAKKTLRLEGTGNGFFSTRNNGKGGTDTSKGGDFRSRGEGGDWGRYGSESI